MITYVPAAWSFTCHSERWILLVYFFVLFLNFLRKTDGSIHDDIFHLLPGTCMNLYVTVSCKLWESLKAFNHATGNPGWRVCFAAFSFSYLIDIIHFISYSYPLFLASAVGSAGRGSGSGCGRLLGQMAHSPQMGAELSVEMTWHECAYLCLSLIFWLLFQNCPISIIFFSIFFLFNSFSMTAKDDSFYTLHAGMSAYVSILPFFCMLTCLNFALVNKSWLSDRGCLLGMVAWMASILPMWEAVVCYTSISKSRWKNINIYGSIHTTVAG